MNNRALLSVLILGLSLAFLPVCGSARVADAWTRDITGNWTFVVSREEKRPITGRLAIHLKDRQWLAQYDVTPEEGLTNSPVYLSLLSQWRYENGILSGVLGGIGARNPSFIATPKDSDKTAWVGMLNMPNGDQYPINLMRNRPRISAVEVWRRVGIQEATEELQAGAWTRAPYKRSMLEDRGWSERSLQGNLPSITLAIRGTGFDAGEKSLFTSDTDDDFYNKYQNAYRCGKNNESLCLDLGIYHGIDPGRKTLWLNGQALSFILEFSDDRADDIDRAQACGVPTTPPSWLTGSWGGMLAATDGTAINSYITVASSGSVHLQSLDGRGELQTLTGSFRRVDQATSSTLDICISANDERNSTRIIGLDFDLPDHPGSTDGLVGRISVLESRPDDGDSNSELTEKAGDSMHGGVALLYRGSPVITSARFVDLPPLPILDNVVKQEPPELKKLLSDSYGGGVMAVVWLRLRGLDLPTQGGRIFSLDFEDASVSWTGEVRVPFPIQHGAAPEVLDVRVTLTKAALPGLKRFWLNGSEASVRFGGEPNGIAVIAPEPISGDWVPVQEVMLGVPFAVGVSVEGARYDPVRVALGQGGETSHLELVPVQNQNLLLFESKNILPINGSEGFDREQMTYSSLPGGKIQASVLGDNGQAGGLEAMARITAPEPGIWGAALRRAQACRAAGVEEKISALILTPNFFEGRVLPESLEVNIPLEDHAAAIILRDEMMQLIGQYIDIEDNFFRTPPGEARAEVRQIIEGARRHYTRIWYDDTVGAPVTGELIPLATALSRRMESASFKGDRERFEKYADNVIRVARETAIGRIRNKLNDIRDVDPCDIEAMLKLLRPGVQQLVASASRKLVRRAKPGEEPDAVWVPNRPVLLRLATIGKLIEAIEAQGEYNDLDTIAAISYVAVPLGFAVSGTAGFLVGGALDIGSVAAFSGADWLEAVRSRDLEEDLEVVLGRERLEYALELEAAKSLELSIDLASMVVFPAGFSVAQSAGSIALQRAMKNSKISWAATASRDAINATERYARNQASKAWSKIRPSFTLRLDDAAYRQAVANAGDSIKLRHALQSELSEDALPPGKFVGGNVDEVAEQLERLGIPGKELRAQLLRLREHGLPPDVAAARLLMRQGIDPGDVIGKLNIEADDLARLLDQEMIAEGIADPILRAKKIRRYMGADHTPPEIYYAAETGKDLGDRWWDRAGEGVGGRRITVHPRQLEEYDLIRKFEQFGLTRSEARARARRLTRAFEPDSLAGGNLNASGDFSSPRISRNPVQWDGFNVSRLDATVPDDSGYLFRRSVSGELDSIPESKYGFEGGNHGTPMLQSFQVTDALGNQTTRHEYWQVPGKRIVADDGTFIELGEQLGSGLTSAIFRDATGPGNKIIRINKFRSASGFGEDKAIVADYVGRQVGEAIEEQNGLFRLTKRESKPSIVRDADNPQVRYLVSVEENIEDAVSGISNAKQRFAQRNPNAKELATMNLAIREMNRRGVVWTDHKLANFDIVPNPNTSTGYQMVIFDTGGLRPVKGATPKTRWQTARELQRFFDETPQTNINVYTRYHLNKQAVDQHLDNRVFGTYAVDDQPLMTANGQSRSDGYHDLNRLSYEEASEVLAEILGRKIQLAPVQ